MSDGIQSEFYINQDEDIRASEFLPYVKRVDPNSFIWQSIYMRNATGTKPLYDYFLRQLRGQRMGIEGRAEYVMTFGLGSRDNFSEKISTFIIAQEDWQRISRFRDHVVETIKTANFRSLNARVRSLSIRRRNPRFRNSSTRFS